MYTSFSLSFFHSFCLDICRVSVKCVVNVFYSIKILGAYKLRTSRTSGDINFALVRGPKDVSCLVSMCLCLYRAELKECEVEREKKNDQSDGKLLTYFFHNDFAGMLMRTYTSFRMTCIWKQSSLIRLAKQTNSAWIGKTWAKIF